LTVASRTLAGEIFTSDNSKLKIMAEQTKATQSLEKE